MKSPKENKIEIVEKEDFILVVRSPFEQYSVGEVISERNDIKAALLRANQNVVKVSTLTEN